MSNINIQRISITDITADAIVNAANSGLQMGGGVCGAIFEAAGFRQLQAACNQYGHCDTGSAVITPGFKTKAKYIIHAVGPVYSEKTKWKAKQQLRSAYRRSLELAKENDCHSIAFPLISAGIFGYPMVEAWKDAIWACNRFIHEYSNYDIQITFTVLDSAILDEGQKQLYQLLNNPLVQTFEDTRKRSYAPSCEQETLRMVRESKIYPEGFTLKTEGHRYPKEGGYVEVDDFSTYECARRYSKLGKTAVLNFANAVHPGGGVVHGARAQEESLCRTSNLYEGLIREDFLREYYGYHEDKELTATDRLIYHPGVTVFMTNGLKLMPESNWFQTDVITCAAPRSVSMSDQEKIHYSRGRNIINAAIDNDVEYLILGAFGCGAFHNDPAIVAEAYRKLLVDEGMAVYFKKVIFAIISDHNDKENRNFKAFEDILDGCFWDEVSNREAPVVYMSSTPDTTGSDDLPQTSEDQKFVFFWLLDHENEEFSQWYPCRFVIEGVEYTSAEQYMMAKKALAFHDVATYQRIMMEHDPALIKDLGRQVTPFDKDRWDRVNEEVLFNANLAKFEQNPELKEKLLSTGTAILAEASPKDMIYGIGFEAEDPRALDPTKWKGQNVLGDVLMRVRDQLR